MAFIRLSKGTKKILIIGGVVFFFGGAIVTFTEGGRDAFGAFWGRFMSLLTGKIN